MLLHEYRGFTLENRPKALVFFVYDFQTQPSRFHRHFKKLSSRSISLFCELWLSDGSYPNGTHGYKSCIRNYIEPTLN